MSGDAVADGGFDALPAPLTIALALRSSSPSSAALSSESESRRGGGVAGACPGGSTGSSTEARAASTRCTADSSRARSSPYSMLPRWTASAVTNVSVRDASGAMSLPAVAVEVGQRVP